MRNKHQNNYKILASHSLEIYIRDISILIEGLIYSIISIITFTILAA